MLIFWRCDAAAAAFAGCVLLLLSCSCGQQWRSHAPQSVRSCCSQPAICCGCLFARQLKCGFDLVLSRLELQHALHSECLAAACCRQYSRRPACMRCADHVSVCAEACRYGRRSAWRTMRMLGRSARAASPSSRIQSRWVLLPVEVGAGPWSRTLWKWVQLVCRLCCWPAFITHSGGGCCIASAWHHTAAVRLLFLLQAVGGQRAQPLTSPSLGSTCLAAQPLKPHIVCFLPVPLQVTRILAELRMDYESLVAGGCCLCRSFLSTLPRAVARWPRCCCCCHWLRFIVVPVAAAAGCGPRAVLLLLPAAVPAAHIP